MRILITGGTVIRTNKVFGIAVLNTFLFFCNFNSEYSFLQAQSQDLILKTLAFYSWAHGVPILLPNRKSIVFITL